MNKNSGGNQMSKSHTARRIALLSSSSFGLAAIVSAASLGAALTPTAAAAQATCTSGTAVTGNASNTVTIAGGNPNNPGVTCAYVGTGATVSTTSATTVSTVANPPLNGINLSATGAGAINWVSTAGTVTGGAQTNGPVIEATSGAGAINITTASVTGSAATVTKGIVATSTSGAITLNTGTVSATNAVSGVAGIEATTSGAITLLSTGNISGLAYGARLVSTGNGGISATGRFGGSGVGIDARSTGGDVTITTTGVSSSTGTNMIVQAGGNVTLNFNGGSVFTSNPLASPAVIATAGGAMDITLNSGFVNGTINATAGGVLNITAQGGAIASDLRPGVGGYSIVGASPVGVNLSIVSSVLRGAVDFSGSTGKVTLITSGATIETGVWRTTGASRFGSGDDTLTMSGTGSNTLTNGSIDFGAGADTFNIAGNGTIVVFGGAFSSTNGALNFGAGDDLMNIPDQMSMSDGAVDFGVGDDRFELGGAADLYRSTIDFGAGSDIFNHTGVLRTQGTTSFLNLESFNNAGTILLGGFVVAFDGSTNIDGVPDDVLRMTGGVFTGGADSRIVMDANLGASGSQLACTTAGIADCADFTGASTAGTTLLTVNDSTFSVDGGSLGVVITLVDGSTAAGDFILDPASRYYADTANGPAIRKPVVQYLFVYDDAAHRHVLVGAPGAEMLEVGTYAASAQETWRATTGSWLTRQADLRAAPLESSRGVWARIGGQAGERELETAYEVQGLSLDYDLGHKQKIAHLTFGADLLGGLSDDSAWVLGGMLGYVRSDVEYEATPTEMTATGALGGLYASYVAGPLFLDGVFNANILHVKTDAPAMNLGLDVPMTFDLTSIGGQIEGGWRVPLGSGLFIEPLAGVSYVTTRIEDAEVPGGAAQFEFEESTSLRAGVGARVGIDSDFMGAASSLSLTGRYWKDAEGEGSATVTTATGSSALLPDEFTGEFAEVGASLSVYSAEGGVSGFVNFGGKFASGYQSVDGSIGVRVRW